MIRKGKKKNNKLNLFKLKAFALQQSLFKDEKTRHMHTQIQIHTEKERKQETDCKKIFANNLSNKRYCLQCIKVSQNSTVGKKRKWTNDMNRQ